MGFGNFISSDFWDGGETIVLVLRGVRFAAEYGLDFYRAPWRGKKAKGHRDDDGK